jgi:EAL and modified HD-GYP domain-containing signal transduction protein
VVKLDLKQIPLDALPALVMQFKLWPVRVLAEKIDSLSQAQRCLDLGIDMFQGYYFARPEIISGRRLDPTKVALLRLLSMVLSDASNLQIEAELKRHPELIFNLLSIANSVAYGTGKKVISLRQCLVILGRRQLQRWVQLLLYAVPHHDMAENPLLHTAATRARLMELLTQRATQANSEAQDRAFMVGILSLLDVLWQIPMAEIVNQLPIEAQMKEALTSRSGCEGKLLSLIESHESNDVEAVQAAFRGLQGITLRDLIEADLQAVVWADQLSAA